MYMQFEMCIRESEYKIPTTVLGTYQIREFGLL